MKRFYKTVSTTPREGGGYAVLLDGREVLTPLRFPLVAETLSLASEIAAEWDRQGTEILPRSMPLTRIVTTALDKVVPDREAKEREVLGYLDTDLLCYRAEGTGPYGGRQREVWDPILSRLREEFGEDILTTESLSALRQPESLRGKMRDFIRNLSPVALMALCDVTAGTGSLLLAVAFLKGVIGEGEALAAALAEEGVRAEIYHESFYGSAPDQERGEEALRGDLAAVSLLLSLIRPPDR